MRELRKIGALEFYDEYDPCPPYPLERIEEIWAGRQLNVLDILDLDLPVDDRIWGATRLIDDRTNLLLAAEFAERGLLALGITDTEHAAVRCLAAIRAYVDGAASHEDLVAAYSAVDVGCQRRVRGAAYRAVYRAVYYAAYCAASDAARDAAYNTAYVVTYNAAHVVAYSASYRDLSTDRVAERAWQIARIKEVLS